MIGPTYILPSMHRSTIPERNLYRLALRPATPLGRTSSIDCSFKGFNMSKNNRDAICYGGRLPLPLGSSAGGLFRLFRTAPVRRLESS